MEEIHVSLPNGEGVINNKGECNSSTSHQDMNSNNEVAPSNGDEEMNKDLNEYNSNNDSFVDVVVPEILAEATDANDKQTKNKKITMSMVRPIETKSSQLRHRTKSDPPQTLLAPHKLGFKRQSIPHKEEAAPNNNQKPGSVKGKQIKNSRSLSQSTSSDDNSEKDITEVASSKGVIASSDFKSKNHWIIKKAATTANAQGSASARHEFAESHHLFGLSGPAKKTPPPSASRVKTQEDAMHPESSPQQTLFRPPHMCPSPTAPADKYLTPLQQKDRQLKESNVHILKLDKIIQEQVDRIRHFEEEKENELDELRNVKDVEMGLLLGEIKKLEQLHDQSECTVCTMQESLDSQKQIIVCLKQDIEALKKEIDDREILHQQRYLDMYQKGREAQLIDQEEDLMCSAIAAAPVKDAPTRHLVKSLEKKEQELEKLRQTFREEVYHKSPLLDTDSEAQVEILKSAVYYYLTDTQADTNLSVMLSMLSYSPVQKTNIIGHLKKKKSK